MLYILYIDYIILYYTTALVYELPAILFTAVLYNILYKYK